MLAVMVAHAAAATIVGTDLGVNFHSIHAPAAGTAAPTFPVPLLPGVPGGLATPGGPAGNPQPGIGVIAAGPVGTVVPTPFAYDTVGQPLFTTSALGFTALAGAGGFGVPQINAFGFLNSASAPPFLSVETMGGTLTALNDTGVTVTILQPAMFLGAVIGVDPGAYAYAGMDGILNNAAFGSIVFGVAADGTPFGNANYFAANPALVTACQGHPICYVFFGSSSLPDVTVLPNGSTLAALTLTLAADPADIQLLGLDDDLLSSLLGDSLTGHTVVLQSIEAPEPGGLLLLGAGLAWAWHRRRAL